MKWVKASERLPERNGEYFVIDNGFKNIGIFEDGYFWSDGHKIRVSKWVDESPTPAGGKTAEEWLINEGYAEIITIPRDSLQWVLSRYAAQQTAPLSARIAELEKEYVYWKMEAAAKDAENNRLTRNLKAATALLEELGEYMDARADSIDGETPRPNTEMCFSESIDALLEKIKK